MHFFQYLKTAFLNHWNLLALFGGAGFAVLSGHPDVGLPLVLAAEIAYVGLLGRNPKFQKYVDAQAAKAERAETAQAREETLQHILRMLPRESLDQFENLRRRCQELSHIALELKRPGMSESDVPLEQFQTAGLDRLLWIYLRLLYTQYALSRFLQKTREEQIQQDISQLEARLKPIQAQPDDPRLQRVRKALEDNLETSRSRLANLQKARENFQLVQLEIERLENKIQSLSEMAVNRQEPEFISSQVDSVASSMMETERTMNELQFATGLSAADDESPQLLGAKTLKARR